MRQIKVSDETYERLSEMAKRSYRTLGRQIDFMVDAIGNNIPKEITQYENNIPFQKITVTPLEDTPTLKIAEARTPREILREIKAYEEMIANEEQYNQDPESREENVMTWKQDIQDLWNEYHSLKEA